MNPRVHITRNNTLTGATSPVGVIIPDFVGQEYSYNDGVTKKIFKAKGLTSDDWLELGEVPEIDLSEYATNEKVDSINDEVQQNKTSILNKVNIVVTQDKNITRKDKTFYFIVTDEQSGGSNINGDIKVSPNMGIKIV